MRQFIIILIVRRSSLSLTWSAHLFEVLSFIFVLNIESHVIGPSFYCMVRTAAYTSIAHSRESRVDLEDHA